jgi:uncharacterized protein YbbK (DUF523 family)
MSFNETKIFLDSFETPSQENPLPVLFSACLTGLLCGYDESSYGDHILISELLKYNNIKGVRFCPEHASFGTPRALCNIHGGDGYDVLNHKAKVLTEEGEDWTEGMIEGAKKMTEFALENNVKLAVMMDISAACGSQVIYNGHRLISDKRYQRGVGVAAAYLQLNGIHIITQRNIRSLQLLFKKLDPNYLIDPNAKDHDELDWYKGYFK